MYDVKKNLLFSTKLFLIYIIFLMRKNSLLRIVVFVNSPEVEYEHHDLVIMLSIFFIFHQN